MNCIVNVLLPQGRSKYNSSDTDSVNDETILLGTSGEKCEIKQRSGEKEQNNNLEAKGRGSDAAGGSSVRQRRAEGRSRSRSVSVSVSPSEVTFY